MNHCFRGSYAISGNRLDQTLYIEVDLSSHQDCKKLTNIALTLLLYIRQVGILHINSHTIRIDLYCIS